MGKLSLEPDSRGSTSFTNIVMGQSKHEVARAFSALLQLVITFSSIFNCRIFVLCLGDGFTPNLLQQSNTIFFLFILLMKRVVTNYQVNNGDVDLQRSQPCDKVICYTSTTPFHVRLLKNSKREEPVIRPGKKRVKSPLKKRGGKSTLSPKETSVPVKSSQHNGRSSVKLAKNSAGKCTPDGKRRRRSRLIDTVDILSAG